MYPLQSNVVIPDILTTHIELDDVFTLLEAQRAENLLIDNLTATSDANILNRYHAQLLMAQRLQRAELEVALYRFAITQDGLCLLQGNFTPIEDARYLRVA